MIYINKCYGKGHKKLDDNHCALCGRELLLFTEQNTQIADLLLLLNAEKVRGDDLHRQLAEAQAEITEWEKTFDDDLVQAKKQIPILQAEIKRLRKGMVEIKDHPHCDARLVVDCHDIGVGYFVDCTNDEKEFCMMGIAAGHRCAAEAVKRIMEEK